MQMNLKSRRKILDSPLECTGFVKNTFYGSVDVKNPGILYIAYPYNDGFKNICGWRAKQKNSP